MKSTKQIIFAAHRCGAGLAPENTLAGVRESLKYKPDRIEIDVHQTKDNIIVVNHDNSIDRTTNGSGEIKNMTYAEILQYNVTNSDGSISSEKIPTLDQIFDAIDGKSVLLIEIKNGIDEEQGIEKRVLDIIEKHNSRSWTIIQSFNMKILEKVHSFDKTIEIHKLYVGKFPIFPIWINKPMECGSLKKYNWISEISINGSFANKGIIKYIHKFNKKVNVWTVDDPDKIQKLINRGIDGVITNHPELKKRFVIE